MAVTYDPRSQLAQQLNVAINQYARQTLSQYYSHIRVVVFSSTTPSVAIELKFGINSPLAQLCAQLIPNKKTCQYYNAQEHEIHLNITEAANLLTLLSPQPQYSPYPPQPYSPATQPQQQFFGAAPAPTTPQPVTHESIAGLLPATLANCPNICLWLRGVGVNIIAAAKNQYGFALQFKTENEANNFAVLLSQNKFLSKSNTVKQVHPKNSIFEIYLSEKEADAVAMLLQTGTFVFPPSLGKILFILEKRLFHERLKPIQQTVESTPSYIAKADTLQTLMEKITTIIQQEGNMSSMQRLQDLERVFSDPDLLKIMSTPSTSSGSAAKFFSGGLYKIGTEQAIADCLSVVREMIKQTKKMPEPQ